MGKVNFSVGLKFRVQGLDFRVQGLQFRVQDLEFGTLPQPSKVTISVGKVICSVYIGP